MRGRHFDPSISIPTASAMAKGDARAMAPVGQPSPIDVGPQGDRLKWGIRVWPVNGAMIKEELYRWLHLERPTEESGAPYPPAMPAA